MLSKLSMDFQLGLEKKGSLGLEDNWENILFCTDEIVYLIGAHFSFNLSLRKGT